MAQARAATRIAAENAVAANQAQDRLEETQALANADEEGSAETPETAPPTVSEDDTLPEPTESDSQTQHQALTRRRTTQSLKH